jgi:hypothetical protein
MFNNKPQGFAYVQHIHNHYTQEIRQQKTLTNTLNSAINTLKSLMFVGRRHHEHSARGDDTPHA